MLFKLFVDWSRKSVVIMPGFEVLSMPLVIDNYYRLRYYSESENDLAKCEFYNKQNAILQFISGKKITDLRFF